MSNLVRAWFCMRGRRPMAAVESIIIMIKSALIRLFTCVLVPALLHGAFDW